MVLFYSTAEKELIPGYRDYLPKTSVIPLFPSGQPLFHSRELLPFKVNVTSGSSK